MEGSADSRLKPYCGEGKGSGCLHWCILTSGVDQKGRKGIVDEGPIVQHHKNALGEPKSYSPLVVMDD